MMLSRTETKYIIYVCLHTFYMCMYVYICTSIYIHRHIYIHINFHLMQAYLKHYLTVIYDVVFRTTQCSHYNLFHNNNCAHGIRYTASHIVPRHTLFPTMRCSARCTLFRALTTWFRNIHCSAPESALNSLSVLSVLYDCAILLKTISRTEAFG
jgi:hypothetical protein